MTSYEGAGSRIYAARIRDFFVLTFSPSVTCYTRECLDAAPAIAPFPSVLRRHGINQVAPNLHPYVYDM